VNLLDSGAPFYDVYETADGRYMAVGALEPQFFGCFLELLFAPDGPPADLPAQHDRARWPELRARLAGRFASQPQADWTNVFEGTDACVAPVLPMTEAPHNPHLAARGTYAEIDAVLQPAPAPRFSGAGRLEPGRMTQAGEHTREVLASVGFGDVAELLAEGVAVQR
jgi:alpha-methylacyl-CoA racemase